MKFKVHLTLTEAQLANVKMSFDKVTPAYKSLNDDLTEEVEWICHNKNMIVGAACEFVWDMYYTAFYHKKILTKTAFYKLVRNTLCVKNKPFRLSSDTVKYCFVSKSTS